METTTETSFIQDIIDALMFAIGAKTATVAAPITAGHLRYLGLAAAVAGWVGGIYRAKTNPNVNMLGFGN